MQTVIGHGQVATGLLVNAGDLLTVDDSGTASSVDRADGGVVHATTVNGGDLYLSFGTADATNVDAAGELTVGPGGLADGTVLNSGRIILYDDSAQANNTTINAGGRMNGTGYTHNTIVNNGGRYDIEDNRPFATHDNITVNDGGVLSIGDSYEAYSGLHLASGGSVNLAFASYESGTAILDSSTDKLNVSYQFHVINGDTSTLQTDNFSLQLTGDYSTTAFSLGPSDHGSALVTAQPLCFCDGTLIQTPSGEIEIEKLRVGCEIVTGSGHRRTIRWIGSSTFIVNDVNRPVRIRAGAFSTGLPRRDLYVTPGHSFLFGDVLIPIGKLLNGCSIASDETIRVAKVHHLELDAHDVVIANGAHAESYRDDGNRSGFPQSFGEARASRSMPTCYPVVSTGPVVERTRRRLIEQAGTSVTAEAACLAA